jgi:hydroxymethylpyrimidine/phosphomethylpyrimidine kinase
MNTQKAIPVVMTLAGNDPTGGAGIQADIESIISMGCHAAPVITALTVQDTTSLQGFAPIDAELIIQQARAVLEDMPVTAIKIGMVGSIEAVQAIHSILMDYPHIPVVLDPVINAGGGGELADDEVIDGLRALLLPLTTVLTPNSLEARRLAPESDNLDACAMALLDQGAEFVLLTGAHENTPQVHNSLYGNHRKLETFNWARLEGSYHGSGCTLASAIAGLLAQGTEPLSAVHEAQEYTWQALNHGYRIGMGQRLPNRLFWASSDEDNESST